LSKIEPGEYTLIITSIGFENLEKVIKVEADEANTQKIYLEKRARELKAFRFLPREKIKFMKPKWV